jgi:2-methylisocitrate lyase-like PEP mutase family enzyme
MVQNIGTVQHMDESATAVTTKAARFRQLLQSPNLDFLLEAHNGLSAKVVEEAGFDGIWASGLSISGVVDPGLGGVGIHVGFDLDPDPGRR